MLLRLNGQISTATLRTLVESLPRRLKVMLWQQSGTHSSLNAHGLGPGTYRSDDQASTYFWPCIINNITTIPTDVVTNDERKKKWIEILYVFHLLVVLLNSISRFLIRLITRIRCLRECLWIAQACGLPWGSWISMQSLMVSFAHKRDYDSTEGQYIVYMLYIYIPQFYSQKTMQHCSIITIHIIITQLSSMNLPLLHCTLSPRTGTLYQEEVGPQCSRDLSPGTPAFGSLLLTESFPHSTETLLPRRHTLEDLEHTTEASVFKCL